MKPELAAVYHELLRRQKAGEKSVYLSDETLQVLRDVAAAAEAEAPAKVEPVAKEPAPKPKVTKPSRPTAKMANEIPEVPAPPSVALPDGTKAERMKFLREKILSDDWCQSQLKPGKKVVPGIGSLEAQIFFCGEAPGAEEEIEGEPFVGPAGQLLTKIIQTMGLSREAVYIGNIMTYRPPVPGPVGNRPPAATEMAYCLPYLLAQLEIIQPKVIVALGKTALDGLLGADPKRRMGKIRGHWQSFNDISLMPTYHPSYLLRNQGLQAKRHVWEDVLAVMEQLEMPISEKQRSYFLKP
ncbi:uracil-DNA glycosylase [Puniceicoccales bacterium CK1056]|uniref:Type-4 uracil-DNA glycosylase n=1 Tax=Oceanipulchritudo coccoides TaxID=2706888 RepID=A0A6B2M2T1_9BACT|nr:uracil-DNA glycosylase [Oceanipulchritudo coccoides]NDV62622.1 uracil-DNA glycosylase [Oceanipulchritudo coccoides]